MEKRKKVRDMNVNSGMYRQKRDIHRELVDAKTPSKIKQRRHLRKKRRKTFNIFIIVLVCLAAFALGGKTLLNYFQDTAKILRPPGNDDTTDWKNAIAKNFDKDIINFALLGFDRNKARDKIYTIYRPDSIMIVSINFKTKEISMASIPRDTYVKVHGRNIYDKINHSYMYGYQKPGKGDPHLSGIKSTVRTIQDFLGGVPIHYYIALDMDAVEEVIDAIGGVYYDVDVPVRDRAGKGKLVVDKGYQLLDGKKFLEMIRFRAIGGDTGRANRQQDALVAAFKQLKEKGKLTQIPKIYKSLNANIDTNLTVSQIGALALYGMEVDMDNIKTYLFEGSGQFAPLGEIDIYYMVPDEQQRVRLIKEIFNVDVPARAQINLPGRRPAPKEPDPVEIFEPQPQKPEIIDEKPDTEDPDEDRDNQPPPDDPADDPPPDDPADDPPPDDQPPDDRPPDDSEEESESA